MEIRVGSVRWFKIALIIPMILFIFPVFALAGGGQQYPNGVEAFLIGVAPPPGFYLRNYFYYYTATKLKNNSGDTMKVGTDGVELDRLSVYGYIPRLIWISKLEFLGGFYGQHLFVPLLDVDLKLNTPGGDLSDRRGGVGNLIYSPFIWTWHAKDGLLHMITALDIYMPTGPYDAKNLVNVGKNFWTFEPVFAITGFLPWHPNLSASIKLMYDFNTPNNDYIVGPATAAKIGNPGTTGLKTHLTPGQEFHFDYSVEYAITKDFRAGITGYFYQQTTNDSTGFGEVQNDKGRVFAIGPGVWYNYKRWFFDLHGAWETAVKNRPEGFTGLFTVTYCF